MSPRAVDFAILALGVAAVSTAAVLIREADAPALVIATYRLGLASLPLLIVSGASGKRLVPGSRHAVTLTLLSGLFLAFHFAFWIASLQQTSVLTSVVLVTLQPLFVALASGPLLGERPRLGTWLGIGLAVAGGGIMVAEDIGSGRDTLRGDLFAVVGAVFAAAYILCGRSLRTRGDEWLPYVTRVYSVAAAVLLALVLVSGDPLGGYSLRTYGFFALLALVPQLIGHTAINRSLGYLPAATVAVAILGEPVGASLLAALFLDETPSAAEGAGAFLVLAGVYAGVRGGLTGQENGTIARSRREMMEPGEPLEEDSARLDH